MIVVGIVVVVDIPAAGLAKQSNSFLNETGVTVYCIGIGVKYLFCDIFGGQAICQAKKIPILRIDVSAVGTPAKPVGKSAYGCVVLS